VALVDGDERAEEVGGGHAETEGGGVGLASGGVLAGSEEEVAEEPVGQGEVGVVRDDGLSGGDRAGEVAGFVFGLGGGEGLVAGVVDGGFYDFTADVGGLCLGLQGAGGEQEGEEGEEVCEARHVSGPPG